MASGTASNTSSSGSTRNGTAASTLLQQALQRYARCPCNHRTTYTHDNIKERLHELCPKYSIEVPCYNVNDATCPQPTHFPLDPLRTDKLAFIARRNTLRRIFRQQSLSFDDAEYELAGSCEASAVTLTLKTVNLILDGRGNKRKSVVLPEASRVLCVKLNNRHSANAAAQEHQIRTLFAPVMEMRRVVEIGDYKRHMWESTFPGQATRETKFEWTMDHCLGVSHRLQDMLTERCCKRNLSVMPIYILTYIWDEDELGVDDFSVEVESAVYSVHCFGLIIDPVVQKLTLVDPNGPLVPGMSMEFLVVPHVLLGAGVQASTKHSSWDRAMSMGLQDVPHWPPNMALDEDHARLIAECD